MRAPNARQVRRGLKLLRNNRSDRYCTMFFGNPQPHVRKLPGFLSKNSDFSADFAAAVVFEPNRAKKYA